MPTDCSVLRTPTILSNIRGIYIPLLCSYWGGSQGLSPTYEQAHVGLDLLTLASIKLNYRKSGEHRDVIPILTAFMMSPYLQ